VAPRILWGKCLAPSNNVVCVVCETIAHAAETVEEKEEEEEEEIPKSKTQTLNVIRQARVDAAEGGEEEEEEEVLEAPEIETLVKEELESAKEKGQMLQVLSTARKICFPNLCDAGSRERRDLNPIPCTLYPIIYTLTISIRCRF
jgi:hypothetical protein